MACMIRLPLTGGAMKACRVAIDVQPYAGVNRKLAHGGNDVCPRLWHYVMAYLQQQSVPRDCVWALPDGVRDVADRNIDENR